LAYIDPLTGVANRREFDRQLAGRMAADRDFCILLFDVDAFKLVNDRFGHLCGDEVLKQLGARLARQVRSHDFVCRWGGDEFVAMLECALPVAVTRAKEIAQCLSGPYHVTVEQRQLSVEIAVSVGMAARVAGETPAQLFQRVDSSLYSKKTAG
jgi:diguanylate cyclase (GGDEF)-like protein